jgi:hypothetical protein
MILDFENEVSIVVRDGATNEVKHEWHGENAISDDLLATLGHVFYTVLGGGGSTSPPYCFLLPDGTNWSGFTYDRSNPWAPYCITANNSIDTGADTQWKSRASVGGFTPPTNPVTGRAKFFFSWNNLPTDLQLRGIGLTGWQSETAGGDINDASFGAGTIVNQQPTVFVPQTLVVLPSAVLVHGRNGGSGTPDVLQISYFLSIVGVS